MKKKWNFFTKYSPTRHIEYEVIDFAPSIKSFMAGKILSDTSHDF